MEARQFPDGKPLQAVARRQGQASEKKVPLRLLCQLEGGRKPLLRERETPLPYRRRQLSTALAEYAYPEAATRVVCRRLVFFVECERVPVPPL